MFLFLCLTDVWVLEGVIKCIVPEISQCFLMGNLKSTEFHLS